MTDDRDRQSLIEQVTSAWRPRGRDGAFTALPAWHDLDERGRVEAFEATVAQRAIEAAADLDGLSSTARAILARLRAP